MADTFAVGEIAIYFRPGSPYHLEHVEIAGPLSHYPWINHITKEPGEGLAYLTTSKPRTIAGALGRVSQPKHLRKLPPKEEPASWERIEELTGWNPTKEKVGA